MELTQAVAEYGVVAGGFLFLLGFNVWLYKEKLSRIDGKQDTQITMMTELKNGQERNDKDHAEIVRRVEMLERAKR